jgi:hypothetical protein
MATITAGTTYSATSQVTSTNLNAHVNSATVTGIVQADLSTTAGSLVQIISGDVGATTTEGAALWDKSRDKFGVSDGTTWVNHVQGEAQSTSPRSLTNYEWFDTTLGIKRIYIARNGLTGFHPLENGYLLVNNGSGSALSAGDVVVTDWATGVNHVKATTTIKDQTVIGVCLEAIANGSSGIIATYGCKKNITVNIDETDGALAVGDGIVSYSASNRGRTVGALPTTAYTAATTRHFGTPLGCFAVALSTVSSNQATARMLDRMGTGATQTVNTALTNQTTFDGTWLEETLTPVSAKHAPLVRGLVKLHLDGDAGAAGDNFDVTVVLSADQSVTTQVFHFEAKSGVAGNYEYDGTGVVAFVNSTTTPTAMGTKFAIRTSGTTTSITVQPRVLEYVY